MANEITNILIKIVVGVCFALTTRYLIPYLKTLREDARWQRLINMVQTAVEAAEQTMKDPGSGAEKKKAVMQFVSDWLKKQGIDVTTEELDKLVEAAVKVMNDNKKVKAPTSVINLA